jgi:uncharacterized protein YdaU (DUF1376 family)
MHYYKRNLGDYAKKAGKLTMLQHGSYTLLIDACYDREQFPTLEQAIEWTWATTEDEINAVKFVLDRFFRLDKDNQYVQPRILEELLDYHKKADKNKEIAIEREAKRKQYSTNRAQVVNESSPNHKPITNNHKPITIVSKDTKALTRPEFVSEDVWIDFEKLRKAKKAPLTKTALNGIQHEADKAEITLEAALVMACNRGWTSFKADWIKESHGRQSVNKQTALEARNRQAVEEAMRMSQ